MQHEMRTKDGRARGTFASKATALAVAYSGALDYGTDSVVYETGGGAVAEFSCAEVGPALGLNHRHYVRGYALEQSQRGYSGWDRVWALENNVLARVIGHARSAQDAVELARVWLLEGCPLYSEGTLEHG